MTAHGAGFKGTSLFTPENHELEARKPPVEQKPGIRLRCESPALDHKLLTPLGCSRQSAGSRMKPGQEEEHAHPQWVVFAKSSPTRQAAVCATPKLPLKEETHTSVQKNRRAQQMTLSMNTGPLQTPFKGYRKGKGPNKSCGFPRKARRASSGQGLTNSEECAQRSSSQDARGEMPRLSVAVFGFRQPRTAGPAIHVWGVCLFCSDRRSKDFVGEHHGLKYH